MKPVFLYVMVLLLGIGSTSCSSGKTGEVQEEADQPKMVKKRRDDGTLSSINPVDENGYIHGVKVNFYEDGVTVHSKVTYEHGRKDGPAIWFFKSGKIYEYTNYVQNRREGLTRKYYETGELLEETTYENGEELPGKKRFTKEGELITDR